MVPCLHQVNVYINRNLRVWRAQKCIPLVCAETPYLCGPANYRISWGGIGLRTENLLKLGRTYRHGTMYAAGKYLYAKKATSIERTKMYSSSRWRNLTYLCGSAKLLCLIGGQYRVENGNLHKLGLTYHHGIVFAQKKYLYPKEATGMERPEMYSTSWCKNPTYLCGPANYPLSWGRYRAKNGNLRELR